MDGVMLRQIQPLGDARRMSVVQYATPQNQPDPAGSLHPRVPYTGTTVLTEFISDSKRERGGDNVTEWRLLPYPGKWTNYYASNVGQILGRYASSGKVKVLKPHSPNYSPASSRKGKLYKFASSSPSQALYKLYVHRLVASVFCPCPSIFHTDVDHIDGNKFNNNAANLRWVTKKENMLARYALKRGEIKITNLQKSMFYVA